MKFREWSQRILWFVFGAASLGLLIFISTSYGRRIEAPLPVEPVQSIEDRVRTLEQKVAAIEAKLAPDKPKYGKKGRNDPD
jgi:hypothetical protein